MSEVKRYTIGGTWVSGDEVVSTDEVEMVFASNYDALKAQNAEHLALLRECRKTFCRAYSQELLDRLDAALSRTKEQS